ncbi:MAG: hypothetical protein U0939_09090 [Pirellulales bacterium]
MSRSVWVRQLASAALPVGVLLGGHACALASLLTLSRDLPPSAFGSLSTGLAIQGYVVLVGSCGLRSLVVRELTRSPDRIGELWATQWLVTGVVGACTAFVSQLVSTRYFDYSPAESEMSAFLSLGAWFAVLSVAPLLDARRQQLTSMLIVASCEVVFLLLLFVGWTPRSLPALGAAFAGKWFAMSALQALALGCIARPWSWLVRASELRRLLRPATPLLFTSLITNAPITLSVLAVRAIRGPEEAAVTGLGVQFATGFLLLASAAFRYIQPRLAHEDDVVSPENRRFLAGVAAGLLASVVAIGVVLAAACRWYLPATYAAEMPGMLLMLVAAYFGGLSYLGWACLVALEREPWIFKSYAAGLLLFLACGSIAITSWGVMGAGLAAAVGMGTTALLIAAKLRPRQAHGACDAESVHS